MEGNRLHVHSCAVTPMLNIALRRIGGLCLFAAASAALGLDRESEDSLLDIQTFASQLADEPRAVINQADRELITSIRTKANTINDRFRNIKGSLPKEYAASLSADAEMLRQALIEPSEARRRESLQLAHEDLRLKLLYLQGSAGWTVFSPDNTLVQVSVTSKANGKSVPGYSVQCNPRRYGNASIFQTIFSKLTSPSEGKMAPGIYSCVLEQAGARVNKDISVGLTGSATEEIEVEVSRP